MNEISLAGNFRRYLWQRFAPGLILTGLALLIWAFVHGSYGITWDEPEQCIYGDTVRSIIFGSQNFADFDQAELPANASLYGPLLGLVCSMLAHATGGDVFVIRHGIQGLMWVAMFYPVCALGRRLSGQLGAWCAGLALLGMPVLLGHAFNNPKDLPLACAVVWMLHISTSAAAARRLNWWHAAKLGVATGFMLSMRPGAWFLCALLGLIPLAVLWRGWRRGQLGAFSSVFAKSLGVIVAGFAIGWVLMILPWPHAWKSPFAFPIHAAFYAMRFDAIFAVLFGGTYFPSNHLPWDYLLVYLLLTQPLPLIVLACWGHRIFWQKSFFSVSKGVTVVATLFLFWFPIMMFILLRPNVYDGMRHFLFILPSFALLAGTAAASLIRYLHRQSPPLAVPVVAILLLSAVPDMVRLHPYESVFYNCLAGPRATLATRFETDYWLSSYREAALWLNQATARRQTVSVMLANTDPSALPTFTHFLNPRIKVTPLAFDDYRNSELPTNIDFYIATSRRFQDQNFSTNLITHTVQRDGIVLSVIRENRQNTAN